MVREYVLVGDIGGTNTRLALAQDRKLLCKETYPTHKIHNLSKHLQLFLEDVKKHDLVPARVVLGVAGLHDKDKKEIRMTNAKLRVQEEVLAKDLGLPVKIVNDFVALGFSTHKLKIRERKILREGIPKNRPKIILGVGTGLGKATVYDGSVISSDLHATSFSVENEEELHLFKYLAQDHIPVLEDVLSGRGIEQLYAYHAHQQLPVERIFAKKTSETKAALADFVTFLARVARNEVIDNDAFGGLYLAGGILAKHHGLIGNAFFREFCKHPSREWRAKLKEVPVIILTDEDLGLKGAAEVQQ